MSQPSIAASISRILNKATNLSFPLHYMRHSSPELNQIYLEIVALQNLLTRAYSKAGDSNASAYFVSTVQFLARQDSVFDQTTEVLDSLARYVTGSVRPWPFDQAETKRIWERIRRTNTSLDFALDSVVSRFHIPITGTDADLTRRLAKSTKHEMRESLGQSRKTESLNNERGEGYSGDHMSLQQAQYPI
jgi:hypothetical protein